MDFAEAGMSLSDFKRKMKNKLKTDSKFVNGLKERLNEIFGKDVI
jgi:hypothetical protein